MSTSAYPDGSAAGDELTTNRGLGIRADLHPTSARRTLVEAYGPHAPARRGAYDRAPRLTALGSERRILPVQPTDTLPEIGTRQCLGNCIRP